MKHRPTRIVRIGIGDRRATKVLSKRSSTSSLGRKSKLHQTTSRLTSKQQQTRYPMTRGESHKEGSNDVSE